MREAMFAIIKKDFRGITGNRRLFTTLMITPLILTTVLPSIFLCTIHFVPDDPDIQNFLKLLPKQAHSETIEQTLAQMLLNYMLPLFFLISLLWLRPLWLPVLLWEKRKSIRWKRCCIVLYL